MKVGILAHGSVRVSLPVDIAGACVRAPARPVALEKSSLLHRRKSGGDTTVGDLTQVLAASASPSK